jgi:hypothetical protein
MRRVLELQPRVGRQHLSSKSMTTSLCWSNKSSLPLIDYPLFDYLVKLGSPKSDTGSAILLRASIPLHEPSEMYSTYIRTYVYVYVYKSRVTESYM